MQWHVIPCNSRDDECLVYVIYVLRFQRGRVEDEKNPKSSINHHYTSKLLHYNTTMKSSLTAAITLAAALPAATLAFAPPAVTHQRCASSLRATLTADELSSKSKEEQFQILGVEEEKLALGIDADEVLQFLGT
eukprot:scaffold9109_cov94-Skeletonema_dohrnii-CCMP3373.AAC.1